MNREWTQQLKQQLRADLPGALALRRQLHQHPERAFQEYQTSQKIREHLARLGIPVLPGVIPTEVTGVIEGSRPGPTLLVREDIDALVMREETGLPFASQAEDCCHACGHDIHTASLLLMAAPSRSCAVTWRAGSCFASSRRRRWPAGPRPCSRPGTARGPPDMTR